MGMGPCDWGPGPCDCTPGPLGPSSSSSAWTIDSASLAIGIRRSWLWRWRKRKASGSERFRRVMRMPLARSISLRSRRVSSRAWTLSRRLLASRGAGHGGLDRGVQARAGHGLEQVLDHAVLHGLVDQVGVAVGGEDDHRRAGVLRDLAGGREAVEAGHLDVHHDHVGQRAAADLDRALAVVHHGHHVVAQGLELALEPGGHRTSRRRRSRPCTDGSYR